MAWTHTQASLNNKSTAAGTTITVAITPTAVGRLIVVGAGHAGTTGTFTIGDTATNTWVVCNAVFNNGTDSMAGWYCYANGTGSTTITVTCSVSNGFRNVLVDEFSGHAASLPVDQHNEASHATTGPPITATMTLGANDCMVWAASNDGVTAVGNIDGSAATAGADDTLQDWSEYRFLTGRSGVGITAAFTGTGGFLIVATSFKPLAGSFVPYQPQYTRAPVMAQ